MLERLGSAAVTFKWWFLATWIVLFAGFAVLTSSLAHETSNNFRIPGTESQQAEDILVDDFPSFTKASVTVVFTATQGDLTSADNSQAVGDTVAELEKISGVDSVSNPLTLPSSISDLSSDKTVAISVVTFEDPVRSVSDDAFEDLVAASEPALDAGLEVLYNGPLVDVQDPLPPGISAYADEIGLGLAAVVLLISFGSVVSMGLPLATAIAALILSTLTLGILEHFFTIGSINATFGTMLGLGVGIDYSLLLLNRYMQDRSGGADVRSAVIAAVATAGRAVIFAGVTVCIAVVSLFVFGVPYLTILGLTSAMYIVLAVFATLTLLPALIAIAGDKIESVRLPFIRKRTEVDPHDPDSLSARWVHKVLDHRRVVLPGGLLVLVLLAIPASSAQLGFVDDGDDPPASTERQSFDLISEAFGPGRNGPLVVVVELPGTFSGDISEAAPLLTLVAHISRASGVDSALGPIPSRTGDSAIIRVFPTTGPSSSQTSELTLNLRENIIPSAIEGTSIESAEVSVGGETAVLIDLDDRISSRLAIFMAVVLTTAFLLLMVVFRSLLVPLKAVLLNVLMFLAVYGIMVMVFQWGWMRDVVGLSETLPIESFVPVVVFAVLFGLSTDYEVFSMSRIREAFDAHGDPEAAIVDGVTSTARVIASAALIMASVFLAFVTNPSALVKMIGLPLGVGILIDAFLIRLTINPAIMRMFGKWAWFMPGWLNRILPSIRIDAEELSTTGEDA